MISYTAVLSGLNILFSLGNIIGLSIISSQRAFFLVLLGTYNFNWFVSVFSFIIGVGGILYHGMPSIKEKMSFNKYGIYFMSGLNFFMSIFWLGAAASMGTALSDCLYIKENFDRFDNTSLNCNGEIISTPFGFANVLVWSIALYYSSLSAYTTFKHPTNEQHELPSTQSQQTHVQDEITITVN